MIKKIIDSTNQLGKNKRLNRCKSFWLRKKWKPKFHKILYNNFFTIDFYEKY